MFRSKAIVLMFAVCALTLSGFALYRLYENHVSSEFKRIMSAATDVHESFIEQHAYLHDARLAVKTKRDAQVLEDLEKSDELLHSSLASSQAVQQGLKDELEDLEKAKSRLIAERDSGNADRAVIAKEVEDMQAKAQKHLDELMLQRQHSNEQCTEAIELFRKVRSELGMTTTPQHCM